MIFDYSLAGIVTVGPAIYLVYVHCCVPSSSEGHSKMTLIGWTQIILYCAIIVAITPVLGAQMTRVFNGERTFLTPVLRPVETVLYRAAGVDERREQTWVIYAAGMLLFHVGGFLILYAILRFQDVLPFNPAGQSAVGPDLSFNTAVSFITNTNWQSYGKRDARCRISPRCSA